MTKTTWLEIHPIDTLFFRGSESMVAGENHEVDTMFPPMPDTIIGAIRTAIMRQKGIAPAIYLANSEQFLRECPILGKPDDPGFSITGPLFRTESGVLLLPAPANWFADPPEQHRKEKWGKVYAVQEAKPLSGSPLGLVGSVANPWWVKNPKCSDMKSLAGWWVTPPTFKAVRDGKDILFTKDSAELKCDQAAILPASSLFCREERVGIALTSERTAKEGHLYSTTHVRLRADISLMVGVNSIHELPLSKEGILQLGGEQRVCRYHFVDGIELPEKPAGEFLLLLCPMTFSSLRSTLSSTLLEAPRASGKLLRVGGWDMAKGFHKPMSAWLPHGTVFFDGNKYNCSQLMTF
ncbi:MAG: type III-B CRISPR module-associated Cmr3 family protein [Dissulfuribacterales bacterium]